MKNKYSIGIDISNRQDYTAVTTKCSVCNSILSFYKIEPGKSGQFYIPKCTNCEQKLEAATTLNERRVRWGYPPIND